MMGETKGSATDAPALAGISASKFPGEFPWRIAVLILLMVYSAGLVQQIHRPWVGLHDWNGAFYSQLARNVIRYPINEHHGIGWIAVGEQTPPAEERSAYANHPPALVWMVALAFKIGGESEAVARVVPIIASMISLLLLVHLIRESRGMETALLAGLIYAMLPMSVYFGRMVNHEAVCLCLMLGALTAWNFWRAEGKPTWRMVALIGWCVSIVLLTWTDWVGVVFAGTFCVWVGWNARKDASRKYEILFICGFSGLSIAGMVWYLVQAGMGGRWDNLWNVLSARSSVAPDVEDYWPRHVVENLTWPVIAASCAGLMQWILVPQSRARLKNGKVGVGVIGISGVIWLAIFWNLFARHSYWMYYVGPIIALLCASGLMAFCKLLGKNTVASAGMVCVVFGIVCFVELIGTESYFARTSNSPDKVEAWTAVHEATRSTDRVAIYEDPVRFERWNGWQQRNIVPPQLTYYMDRAFDVITDPTKLQSETDRYSLYVVPLSVVSAAPERFGFLKDCPGKTVGGQLLLDLTHRVNKPGG